MITFLNEMEHGKQALLTQWFSTGTNVNTRRLSHGVHKPIQPGQFMSTPGDTDYWVYAAATDADNQVEMYEHVCFQTNQDKVQISFNAFIPLSSTVQPPSTCPLASVTFVAL
jgi:hypothetical protein